MKFIVGLVLIAIIIYAVFMLTLPGALDALGN